MSPKFKSIIFTVFLLFSLTHPGSAQCPPELQEKMRNLKWVAYSPANYDPGRQIYPPEESLLKDLELLYAYGFRGVVTYGSAGTLAQIPRLAREAGFQAVIMGVWDIDSGEEIMNATLAAEYVDGYCLGNEGLHSRYSLEELIRALAGIKESTHKPATTTEQVADYANDNVLNLGDWIFPNIHPFLCAVKEPEKAARWIKKHYQRLEKHCPADKIVFFKEVGYPTSGMPEASERNQKKFFENMENSDGILFVYFEAFDQAWKEEPPCEPYWGLFTRFRKPKKYISSLTAD